VNERIAQELRDAARSAGTEIQKLRWSNPKPRTPIEIGGRDGFERTNVGFSRQKKTLAWPQKKFAVDSPQELFSASLISTPQAVQSAILSARL
jgi:hypothetical protein